MVAVASASSHRESTGTIHSKDTTGASSATPVEKNMEYYDGKIDAVFVDDGVAHYRIVYDDGGEEKEVYKDEAIQLLLAANGFD
jgi:hypothetical protein